MTARDLETLFDYSYWANKKLLEVVAKLTSEQFTQQVTGSYGSVRNTLVHIMSTEWGWLDRCGGARRGPRLSAADFPTVTSVTEKWARVEAYLREFLAALRDEDLGKVVKFAIGEGPSHSMKLGQMLHHAAIHGVHHRGQVALLLRSLGYVPGDFDILYYYGRAPVQTAPAPAAEVSMGK
jgi:uncharacterized damage-inducible protein DinB